MYLVALAFWVDFYSHLPCLAIPFCLPSYDRIETLSSQKKTFSLKLMLVCFGLTADVAIATNMIKIPPGPILRSGVKVNKQIFNMLPRMVSVTYTGR